MSNNKKLLLTLLTLFWMLVFAFWADSTGFMMKSKKPMSCGEAPIVKVVDNSVN